MLGMIGKVGGLCENVREHNTYLKMFWPCLYKCIFKWNKPIPYLQ